MGHVGTNSGRWGRFFHLLDSPTSLITRTAGKHGCGELLTPTASIGILGVPEQYDLLEECLKAH